MEKINNKYDSGEQNKIYILGGRGVGKTSFFRLLFDEGFDEKVLPSEKGISKSNLKSGNKIFTIKDLTDNENFETTKFFKNELEDVILVFILFSLDDKDSFEYAKTLIEFIKKNLINNKDLNIILLGNKYDIGEQNKNEIQVSKKEVHQYFAHTENFYYNEISCRTNYNIDKIKKMIEEIEVPEEIVEDSGILQEEERKKKAESCLII